MSFLTSSLVHESHPLLGSSRRRTFGLPAKASARASLRFIPPVILCNVMLCFIMLCSVMLCNVMLYDVMSWDVV